MTPACRSARALSLIRVRVRVGARVRVRGRGRGRGGGRGRDRGRGRGRGRVGSLLEPHKRVLRAVVRAGGGALRRTVVLKESRQLR